ncbi:MAG: methyl-accepting chemotaxis protein [Methanoregula sp.]|jgi:methyl-accepting chemotaxis protein|uniref:HAMP domain-containing methyl-accepting chemotaxis protein n=1 Tax=Methanoregula sp. TaxID=2052170 RepID=UPI003D0ACE09
MQFIDDMKMGKKLIGAFLIITLIAVVIAVIGYTNLVTTSSATTSLYEDSVIPTGQIGVASADFQQLRAELYRYIFVPDSRSTEEQTTIPQLKDEIKAQMDGYRATSLSDADKTNLAKFDSAYADFLTQYDLTIAAAKKNDMTTVNAQLAAGSPLINARTDTVNALKAAVAANQKDAKALETSSAQSATGAQMTMIVATIIGIVIAIALALYLSKSITEPLTTVSTNLKKLSKGIVSTRLNITRKDEIGDMARVMDSYANGLQKFVVGGMKKIAEGDLTVNLKVQDEKDEISPSLNTINATLKALVEEATTLSTAAVQGRLATRGNAEKFKGGYREIVKGVNNTLDAFVAPVNEAMKVSNEYAAGNFTARVDKNLKVQGDFIKFKESLDNIGEQVSKAMRGINTQVTNLASSAEEANASVEEVAAGAGQVAKNAAAVSSNADKTTQGIEQVQRAMEDLSRTIQEVANKAEVVAKIVDDTTTYSKEGMELAQKTESGMQGITKSSNEVNQIILEIKGQMDKISEIVNLITDLANQTNLLALNAAIEAARAGDAGRGFAVVATEVKSLAVESRASAEKIAEMIDNLQKQTNHAVDAVAAANTGVKEGSEALHDTLSSFNKIVGTIDQISRNVGEVAAASEEQAASVEEVTASISEVGKLMQDTAKESTDAAAASEESSAAIDQITKVVGNVNTIIDQVTKEISRFKC